MFDQYLFTDNVQGRGLSVLSKSSGITKKLVNNLDEFTIYEAPNNIDPKANPAIYADACRYNKSFTASPMLMNITYIGLEVTTNRNRNYVAHTLISDTKLNGYAVDYFLNKNLFRKSFQKHEVDGSITEKKELPKIEDIGISPQGSLDIVINNINKDIDFYQQLLQSVVLSVENNFYVKMVNYENPLEILQMLYYVFPVELANLITFNTREYSQKQRIQKTSSIMKQGNEITKSCVYGSVEVVQFFNQSWSKSGGDYKTVFVKNQQYNRINKILDFIKWLTKNNSINAERIKIFKSFIEDKKIISFRQLIETDYFTLENYEKNYSTRTTTAPVIKASTNTISENGTFALKDKRTTKKKRKFKLSIMNVFLSIIVISIILGLGIKLISKVNCEKNPVVDKNIYLVFEDGTKLKKDKFNSNNLPSKTGYIFDGYVDTNGVCVINKEGIFNDEYIFEDETINLTSIWTPKKYKFIIDNSDTLSFDGYTDEIIEIPSNLIDKLNNEADKHTELWGFSLVKNGEMIFSKTSGSEYLFINPYGVLDISIYGEWIKDNSITFYPVYKTQTMSFTFKDFITKKVIKVCEVEYSENGVVPLNDFINSNPIYKNTLVYIYNMELDQYLTIYENNNWNGTQGKLSNKNYDSGNVTLYVRRQVAVYIGDSNKCEYVPYGSNLFDVIKQQMINENYKQIMNTIFYKINNTWIESQSLESIWNELGSKTSLSVSPGLIINFKFNEFNISQKMYQSNESFNASCSFKFDFNNNSYQFFDSIINNNLSAKSLTLNGIQIATNNNCVWIYENQRTFYSLLDNCILNDNKAHSSNFVISDAEFNTNVYRDLLEYAINNNKVVIDLYSIYIPENITIRFGENNKYIEKNVMFGKNLNNWKGDLNDIENNPWGKKCVGWSSNKIELIYDSSEDNLIVNFDFVENIKSSNGIQFNQIYESYQFNITFKIDNEIKKITKNVGNEINLIDEWIIDGVNIIDYYNKNYLELEYKYNVTKFSNDWIINDTSKIEMKDDKLIINEETLENFVEFGTNNNVELKIEKNIKFREYNIEFEKYIEIRQKKIITTYEIEHDKLDRIENRTFKYGDTLTGCDELEFSINSEKPKKYAFIGWKIISNSSNKIREFVSNENIDLILDDKFLQKLYENYVSIDSDGVVTVKLAAIYEVVN